MGAEMISGALGAGLAVASVIQRATRRVEDNMMSVLKKIEESSKVRMKSSSRLYLYE
jgi:hypothetical protein